MLKRLPSDESQRLLAFATEGEWTTPTCPRCGKKMLARESAKGRFWGCPGFPKCRQTMATKKAEFRQGLSNELCKSSITARLAARALRRT